MSDHTLQFDGAQSTATPYYPSTGNGPYTITAADSIVVDREETVIVSVTVPSSTGPVDLSLHHEGGELAWRTRNGAAITPDVLDLGGLTLRGNWYAQTATTTATAFWGIRFEI